MDQNELMQQIANNPQMLAQLAQAMQQNGMIPLVPQNQPNQSSQKQPVNNWNMPTSPMAAIWWNNMINAMNGMMNNPNNQGENQAVPNNQSQQNTQSEQQSDEKVLPIRVITSPDDIKVDQIPMNDKISLFIQDDMSIIYGKRWTNNGTIENLRFVLEKPEQEVVTASNDPAPSNLPFDMEEMMAAVGRVVDSKLEQFKIDYSLDSSNGNNNNNNNNQSKNRNNRKG